MMLASLFFTCLVALPQQATTIGKPTIRFEYESGQEWWTVRVRDYSATKLLDRIAELTARSIEGRGYLEQAPLLTVHLDRRPLDQILEFSLGSVELRSEIRRDAITISPVNADLESDDLTALAVAAWIRATTRFPDSDHAPVARLAQGELAELRGLGQTARNYYIEVTEDYPDSEVVDDAYMRAGRLSARMGLPNEAVKYFTVLADINGSEYRPAARLELARALIELGDWEYSLHIIKRLEQAFPAIDPVERTARALVRASAQNKSGSPVQALRELDGMDEGFDPLGAWEALAIRAKALEAMNMPGEAAHAWLSYSRDASTDERELALEQAARLSLAAGNEMATLFICKEAARLGIAGGFPTYQRKARQALGFAIAGDARGAGTVDRIEHGEALIAEGELTIAYGLFEDLFAGRRGLNETQAARVTRGWATCIASTDGFEEAVSVLSNERARYQTLEAKMQLDMIAARLLENAGLLGRAVDAYQGSY